MNFKTISNWLKACLIALTLSLVACAVTGTSTFHTFTFDALRDSKDVEVLQYRYGDDGGFNTRSTQTEIQTAKISMGTHVAGVMVVGKDLYVKWRIKSTGQILEDTVDLRSRLPLSINKHQLRFIIEDKQLFVYLISYEPVRPYFSQAEADRIRLSHVTLRQKAFDFSLRNRVTLIYPEKQIDPHVPADFRK